MGSQASEESKEERDGAGPESTHVRILLSCATQTQQRQLSRLAHISIGKREPKTTTKKVYIYIYIYICGAPF